jgi:alkylhydroperoxidase family enzyme
MAWIRTVSPKGSIGRLKKIYDEAIRRAGRVFNILRVQSLNPPVLEASIELYKAVMFGPSPLSRMQREALATVTSWANSCFY